MTFQEYIPLAIRTESQHPLGLLSMTAQQRRATRLVHGALGLLTEVAEFVESDSDTNRTEELGDIMWYIAVICDEMQIHPTSWLDGALSITDDDAFFGAAAIADQAKRAMFYGASPDSGRIDDGLNAVFSYVCQELHDHDIPLDHCLQRNLDKLATRNKGNTFNRDGTLNRDLASERKALEGNPEN